MGRAVPSVAPERCAGADCAKSTVELLKQCRGLCPQGHKLESRISRAGHCDGCGVMVMGGELIMDCRACNWYLCSHCHPQIREGASMWDHLASFAGAAAQEVAEVSQWTDSFSIGFSSMMPGISCAGPTGSDYEMDEEIIEASSLFEAREPLLIQPQFRRSHCADDSPNQSEDELRCLKPDRGDDSSEDNVDLPTEVTNPHDIVGADSEATEPEVVADLRDVQPETQPEPEDLLEFSDEQEDMIDLSVAQPKVSTDMSFAAAAASEPISTKQVVVKSANALEPLLQLEPETEAHGACASLIQLEPETEEWDVPPSTAAAGA